VCSPPRPREQIWLVTSPISRLMALRPSLSGRQPVNRRSARTNRKNAAREREERDSSISILPPAADMFARADERFPTSTTSTLLELGVATPAARGGLRSDDSKDRPLLDGKIHALPRLCLRADPSLLACSSSVVSTAYACESWSRPLGSRLLKWWSWLRSTLIHGRRRLTAS
jgi:hypothetical protein